MSNKFDPNELYNRVVHYYIDKKKYSKEKANQIAQRVVQREKTRHTCKNENCGHLMEDHIRTKETCMVLDCDCRQFVS
ncbi:MAG: hypothetical protein KGH89_07885 [Thaumarchaeota archaeon]|nr:hypothetical protein [Nitrososphaerota archaeon]MDE1866377.1 hypothetical protein [Nitrososphaerota archaeon]